MTTTINDQFESELHFSDPSEAALYAQLRAAYQPASRPDHTRKVDSAVFTRMRTTHTRRRTAIGPGLSQRLRQVSLSPVRLASVVLVAVAVATGAGMYLRLSDPPRASAATILRRAAAPDLGSDTANHFVYSVSVTVPSRDYGAGIHTGTASVWVRSGSSGRVLESSQELSPDRLATPNGGGSVPTGFVQQAGQMYVYDAGGKIVFIGESAGRQPWVLPEDIFDGSSLAQDLAGLAQISCCVKVLPRQTLNGIVVDVIRVDGWTDVRPISEVTTLYLDAQTYILQGFDSQSFDSQTPLPVRGARAIQPKVHSGSGGVVSSGVVPAAVGAGQPAPYPGLSWTARLIAKSTVPASDAPRDAFALGAPADATVSVPDPNPASAGFSEFDATCDSTAEPRNWVAGQSLLSLCQATEPGLTAERLVSALAASDRNLLSTAVTAGQITPQQMSDAWTALESRLRELVTETDGLLLKLD